MLLEEQSNASTIERFGVKDVDDLLGDALQDLQCAANNSLFQLYIEEPFEWHEVDCASKSLQFCSVSIK